MSEYYTHKPGDLECALVGTLDFSKVDDYISEALVDKINIKKLGVIKVEVYNKEGPIPHFHLNGDNFKCCICIHKPMYFDHGKYHDKLPSYARKILNKWLSKATKDSPVLTNWELIKIFWKHENPDWDNKYNIRIPKKQPDYSNIENFEK